MRDELEPLEGESWNAHGLHALQRDSDGGQHLERGQLVGGSWLGRRQLACEAEQDAEEWAPVERVPCRRRVALQAAGHYAQHAAQQVQAAAVRCTDTYQPPCQIDKRISRTLPPRLESGVESAPLTQPSSIALLVILRKHG